MPRRHVLFGINCNESIGPKKGGTNKMRILTIAVAFASVFAAQQAVAKSSSKTAATSKKHHKKPSFARAAASIGKAGRAML
jgi:hypothetical protein